MQYALQFETFVKGLHLIIIRSNIPYRDEHIAIMDAKVAAAEIILRHKKMDIKLAIYSYTDIINNNNEGRILYAIKKLFTNSLKHNGIKVVISLKIRSLII